MATILYFGRLAEMAGRSETEVDLPPEVTAIEALCDWIERDDPAFAGQLRAPSVRVAINRVIAYGNAPIAPADEIAFLPPVSGG